MSGAEIPPRISVVVCTMASRRDYLGKCLESLARAGGIGDAEVVLVAREGEDLGDVGERFGGDLPLRILRSRTKGLSEKRNAGVAGARGGIVAFLDDDAIVRPDYLTELRRAFEEGAACIAGAVEPIFEGEVPAELAESPFRIGGFNRHGGEENPVGWIGASCAFGRDRLLELGAFDTRLGAGSSWLPWGEDSEMFRRADERFGVAFAGRVVVRHHIQADRLTREYVLRRAFRTGRALCVIDRIHRPDFWRRASVVPVMWAKAAVRRVGGRGLEGRVAETRLRGYLWQAARLLIRGLPEGSG